MVEHPESGELVEVEYDYTPEQRQVIHPVDISQEGIPAELEITAVRHTAGSPCILHSLTEADVASLEEDVMDIVVRQNAHGYDY